MIFVIDMQIGYFLKKKLYERFLKISEGVMRECKYPPKLSNIPIRVSIYIRYHVKNKAFFLIHSVIMG